MKLITLLTCIGFYLLPASYGSLAIENNPTSMEADDEKPVVVCSKGLELKLMEVTATVVITAKDLEAGSFDNQTAYNELKFSFSKNVKDTKRIYDCNDLGKNE